MGVVPDNALARRYRDVLGAVNATLAAAAVLRAQSGSLVGTVARDSFGHMIGGAEIRLPHLNRVVTTNYLGDFGISAIPPGPRL